MPGYILTVSEINQYLKLLLDNDPMASSVFIKGEISNFKRHSSGHLYFTMKDDGGVIPCVMFKGDAYKIKFELENGMKIIAHGRISVFTRDGRYQLYADDLQPDGIGALYMAYEQLKEKLRTEGLFSPEHKLPLPAYPSSIALVTSPTGAAVRDMLRILGRRYPAAKVLICPVRVQGSEAAGEICEMIRLICRSKAADLIILGRGGGSLEDLWPFNEESVARAIYNANIPIISAVGHEPDVTIADFAADLRAATPSNGAELAVPDSSEIIIRLKSQDIRLSKVVGVKLSDLRRKVSLLEGRKSLQPPLSRIGDRRMLLDYNSKRIDSFTESILTKSRHHIKELSATIEAISPFAVLMRGYAIPTVDGHPVLSVKTLSIGERFNLKINDGSIGCLVESISEEIK